MEEFLFLLLRLMVQLISAEVEANDLQSLFFISRPLKKIIKTEM
jgi:hypothetical protein